MKILPLLILGFVAVMVVPNQTEAGCSSSQPISRIYVIRRYLSLLKGIRYCAVAHSGLILEMTDGRQCVLEYMGDGKSHLYDARPSKTTNCWWGKKCKELTMKDDSGAEYTWTRQMYGTAIPSSNGRVTPQQAQRRMQSLMGSHYDLIKNNCHLGQERLRRYWGMHVSDPYSPNIGAVCGCKLPSWLPNGTLNILLQLVRRYCGKLG